MQRADHQHGCSKRLPRIEDVEARERVDVADELKAQPAFVVPGNRAEVDSEKHDGIPEQLLVPRRVFVHFFAESRAVLSRFNEYVNLREEIPDEEKYDLPVKCVHRPHHHHECEDETQVRFNTCDANCNQEQDERAPVLDRNGPYISIEHVVVVKIESKRIDCVPPPVPKHQTLLPDRFALRWEWSSSIVSRSCVLEEPEL